MVTATQLSVEVRQVRIEGLAFERIINGCEVARDVRKTQRVERRISRKWVVVHISRGLIQISSVIVTDTRRRATGGKIAEVISIPRIDKKAGRRRVIPAKAVD